MLSMKEVFEGCKKLCRKETELTVGRWRQEVGIQGHLQLGGGGSQVGVYETPSQKTKK